MAMGCIASYIARRRKSPSGFKGIRNAVPCLSTGDQRRRATA